MCLYLCVCAREKNVPASAHRRVVSVFRPGRVQVHRLESRVRVRNRSGAVHVSHNGLIPYDTVQDLTLRDEDEGRLLFDNIQQGISLTHRHLLYVHNIKKILRHIINML